MQWTGNIGRTFGQVVLALGIIALVLGILGLLVGAFLVGKASDNPEIASDVGDVLEVLVLGGIALVAAGTLAVVAGIITLGFARALRERLQRRMEGSPAQSATTSGTSGNQA